MLLSTGPAVWGTGGLSIPTTGVYLGIWANPALAGTQEQAIEVREGAAPNGIGRPFALHLIYYKWTDIALQLDSNGVFQPGSDLAGDIGHGRVPVISWKCDQTGTNSDRLIASGDAGEDAVITASAKALAQYPGPVLLRWYWEFNLLDANNASGNQACNGNGGAAPTPQVYADFIGAWQHIWRLFQSAGATNVAFLWNPGHYDADGNPDDPHGYYPGNGFVDWIGLDTYQRTTTATFAGDFGLFYTDFTQSQFGEKPLMAGENGSANFSQYNMELQPAYLQGLLADLQSNLYPRLKAYDYFDAGGPSGAWVLDASGGLGEMAALAASQPFSPAPALMAGTLANGATYAAGGLVPGSWAQVKGTRLSNVTRIWAATDFTGIGNNLPSSLSGVQVKVNNLPAAVYYIDSGQVSFQVPSGVSGTVSVQVINGGIASNVLTAAAAASAPGIFPVIANGTNYPAGVFLDGKYVGDPSLGSAFRNARPGDAIQLFATGLVPTPAGILPASQSVSGVTVTIGSVTFPADFAGLVAVGEFQINFTVPQQFGGLASGTYPISIQVNGLSSPTTISSSPPGLLVIPIQH